MAVPLLQTKLYVPPIRPEWVSRPRLIERLNVGLHRKLTLVSAPAGFGKTTLLSEWIAGCGRLEPPVRVAWLSLDPGDNDLARFLTYLIAALQTSEGSLGQGRLAVLQSPEASRPAINVESVLTTLLNEIAGLPGRLTLVLDDYHVIESLPTSLFDAHPSLWVMYAEVLQSAGRFADIEAVFQSAEAALQEAEPDAHTRDLLGTIASMRATMLIGAREIEGVIALARRALELVRPDNLYVRAAANWVLGYAYQMGGDRIAARDAFSEALAISKATQNVVIALLAATGLGNLEAAENRLYQAAQYYQHALAGAGEHPLPLTAETYLGLGRVCYEWNDLDAAQRHAEQTPPINPLVSIHPHLFGGMLPVHRASGSRSI